MKLLLDENFPQKVLIDFPEHSLSTVQALGWKGRKNGELLVLMGAAGFDSATKSFHVPSQNLRAKAHG